jgi:hypothetical protein
VVVPSDEVDVLLEVVSPLAVESVGRLVPPEVGPVGPVGPVVPVSVAVVGELVELPVSVAPLVGAG